MSKQSTPSTPIEDKLNNILKREQTYVQQCTLANLNAATTTGQWIIHDPNRAEALKEIQAIITTETTRLGASEKHQCGTKPHNKQADTLGAKLLAAIGASGNEFAMGYDDSGDYWHFHSGVRGNGRMLFGTEFNSESCEIEEALEEYLNHIGVSDMLATNSKPPSGESDAPSNALQKGHHDS